MPVLASSTYAPAPARRPSTDEVPGSLHILVVEDDPAQRELLCAALRYFGARNICAVADARSALADLDAAHCDLLVCDLTLPGMDGIELLERAAGCDIGAFAIMSAADAGILAAVESGLVERGANLVGLLPKPLTMDAVGLLLQRLGETHMAPRCAARPVPKLPADAATLEAALRSREFEPFYQPKVALDTGQVLGVEVLARWRRANGELLGPASFIPAMEQTTLIDRLTWQLIDRALAEAACWDAGRSTIAFNLAPRTLEDACLPDRLAALAGRHRIPPERITLELTETAMARDPQSMRDCAARLRLRGFGLAIDDFGTGYSSLALLLGLPFTELKIDRSFVARLATSRKARTLLETMITLGKRLDMEVVAEGVESENDLHLLRTFDCPAAQGFHIARPMSQADLLCWLETRRNMPAPAPRH